MEDYDLEVRHHQPPRDRHHKDLQDKKNTVVVVDDYGSPQP